MPVKRADELGHFTGFPTILPLESDSEIVLNFHAHRNDVSSRTYVGSVRGRVFSIRLSTFYLINPNTIEALSRFRLENLSDCAAVPGSL